MSGGTDDTIAGNTLGAGTGGSITETTELVAGRYRIVRWLGGGGMGRVYEAIDVELDERIALKVLRPGMSEDAIERFRREVKLTRRIQHKNVARMFDIGEHQGEKFLTMELVVGESLKPSAAPVPWKQLQSIAQQICAGLAAAHAVGVVHRDLKPDNILLESGTGRAVITDFGIARTTQDGGGMTQVGAIIGTPRYMSPEQLSGAEVDARSDLFSLGVMLFELATGERPWQGDNAIAVAVAQATTEAKQLDTQTRSDIPPAFAEVLARLIAIDPAHRPHSAEEVGAAISSGTTGLFKPQPAPKIDNRRARDNTAPPPGKALQITTLAVLPTQCAPGDEWLADGMREDLTDTLSTTAGLRVRPANHVTMTAQTDPRELGRELSVEHVVVTSLRRMPTGLRIAARLINVSDGFQIWANKADVPEAEILQQAEALAGGIANALSTRATESEKPTDPRAVELFLRARAEMRHFWGGHMITATDMLEQAVDFAPTSPAILGAYAFAAVQAWVMRGPEHHDRAQRALDRALPYGHGDAYLAAASFWFNKGDQERGAQNLGAALVRSPMSAHAHELAGRIAVEIESLDSARHYFETAIGLDPGREQIIAGDIARIDALAGFWDDADRTVNRLLADRDPAMVQRGWVSFTRFAAWRGRSEDMIKGAAQFSPTIGDNAGRIAAVVGQIAAKRELSPDAWNVFVGATSEKHSPQRQQLMGLQLIIEGALMHERPDVAYDALSMASKIGLMDVVWMDNCPLFEKIRGEQRYRELHAAVANRAARVLGVFHATQTS
ncbi:MAG: protein kinase [Kofleriaceae bacterium]